MFDLTSKSGKELRDKITMLRMHVKICEKARMFSMYDVFMNYCLLIIYCFLC